MGINQPQLGDPVKVLEVTLGCRPEDVAENVIVTPFVPLKSFLRHVDEGSVRELNPRFFFKGFTATRREKPVTVVLTGVGPSRVGDLVSVLSLTPAKRILFAGAVGALHPEWSIGDFFIPTEAADGEGYTRYALDDCARVIETSRAVHCTTELTAALEHFLFTAGHDARKGRVFTIGSIAYESPENLKSLAAAGFDALEMELSAFYAAAARHGLEAAALTYVSDLPLKSSLWQEKTPAEREALAKVWRVLPGLCVEAFSHFKWYEGLTSTIEEVKADIAAGRYKIQTAEEHLAEVMAMADGEE